MKQMKKAGCILLTAVLLLSLFSVQAGADGYDIEVMQVINCKEWVSLRKGPDTSTKRLAQVHLGELVTECRQAENGFYYVTYKGTKGYISGQYLGVTAYSLADGPVSNRMVINCSEWVSLREGPDKSTARILKVPLGAVVTSCVTFGDENFIRCSYNGKTGWIDKNYLAEADYSWQEELKKSWPSCPSRMTVVKCTNWVSLRDLPSTNGGRLEKVPLGAQVTGCVQATSKFIRCTYNGKTGYILAEYLSAPVATAVPTPVPTIVPTQAPTAAPVYAPSTAPVSSFSGTGTLPRPEELLLWGKPELDETLNGGYRLIAQHFYGEDGEVLVIVMYNSFSVPLWSVTESCEEITELDALRAVIGGTEEEPLLILFRSGIGFTAYRMSPVKTIAWQNSTEEAMNLSGCLTATVDADGTLYACGYYDSAPIALGADGQLLWNAVNEDNDVYWPYRIEVTAAGIRVYYDSCMEAENAVYMLMFDRNGHLLLKTVQGRPIDESGREMENMSL